MFDSNEGGEGVWGSSTTAAQQPSGLPMSWAGCAFLPDNILAQILDKWE